MQNILLEGGNVFEDVTSFDHKHIPLMVKTLTNALNGTGINIIPVLSYSVALQIIAPFNFVFMVNIC